MSTRMLTVMLLLALVLGSAALYLTRQNAPASTDNIQVGQRILPIDLADATEIQINHGDTHLIITKSQDQNAKTWLFATLPDTQSADSSVLQTWPIDTARVTAALRLMHQAAARAIPADTTFPQDTAATEVIFKRDEQTLATVRFAADRVGGLVLASASWPSSETSSSPNTPQTTAMIDADVADIFTPVGVRAWRQTAIFNQLWTQADRAHLENDRTSLTFAKAGRGWALVEPVIARADADAVLSVLRALGNVRIVDFLDDPRQQQLASDAIDAQRAAGTTATARIEHTTANSTQACSITLASPRGDGTNTLYARIHLSDDHARSVVIDAAALASITFAAKPYVAATIAPVPPATVGQLALTTPDSTLTYARDLDNWTQQSSTNDPDNHRLLTKASAQQIEDLLEFLATHQAEISITSELLTSIAPSRLIDAGTIELQTLSGDPLKRLPVSVAAPEDSTAPLIVFTEDDIARTVPLQQSPTSLAHWLTNIPDVRALIDAAAAPSTPTDITK